MLVPQIFHWDKHTTIHINIELPLFTFEGTSSGTLDDLLMAKVRVDHARISADLVGCARGDEVAEIHDVDHIGDIEDHIDVVFDEEYAYSPFVRKAPNQVSEVGGFDIV
jgi:hypothetical protein